MATSKPDAHPGDYVYRAISSQSWINQRKEVKAPAFRRRSRFDENNQERKTWDDDGLSFGLSPEDACKHLRETFGVVKLSTEHMLARGFEFDAPRDGQVHVVNMPFYCKETRDEANGAALKMLECVVAYIGKDEEPRVDAVEA